MRCPSLGQVRRQCAKENGIKLKHHPKLGEVLICQFPRSGRWTLEEALKGEMVKDRLVIVVNRKLSGRSGLVNVVPISMTPPCPAMPWHVAIPASCLPAMAIDEREGVRYAKCDMVCTVSLGRLEYYAGHRSSNPGRSMSHRRRQTGRLDLQTLLKVKRALASVLEINAALFADAQNRADVAEIVAKTKDETPMPSSVEP